MVGRRGKSCKKRAGDVKCQVPLDTARRDWVAPNTQEEGTDAWMADGVIRVLGSWFLMFWCPWAHP